MLQGLTFALVIACMAISTSSNSGSHLEHEDVPAIVVVRDFGSRRVEQSVNLLFAMWPDGTIVFRSDYNDEGSRLLTGEAALGSFASLRKSIDASGFLEREPIFLFPPDDSHTRIRVRYDGQDAQHAWTERINPLSDNAQESFQEFLRMWLEVRAAVLTVRPISAQWLEDALDEEGEFRGYNFDEPGETRWLRWD